MQRKSALGVDLHAIKKAALILRSINHELRQKIMKLIASKPEIASTEICVQLRMVQAVGSRHLGILKKAEVVIVKTDGQYRRYTINKQKLAEVDRLAKLMIV